VAWLSPEGGLGLTVSFLGLISILCATAGAALLLNFRLPKWWALVLAVRRRRPSLPAHSPAMR
jgi:hypothetical protein